MLLIGYFTFLLLGIHHFCPITSAIFMWTAPPPAWNQTVSGTANIKTVVIQVLNGSTNFPIRWNYSLLPDQSIEFTYFSMRYGNNPPDGIGAVVKGRPAQIYGAKNFKTRFTIDSTSEFSTLTINKVTERENATFQCKISADQEWAYDVRIEVAVPPKITYISEDKTVNKGDVVSPQCTAAGYPAPNITWTRLSDNGVVIFPLNITGKQDEGTYRCTADNGFGNPASRDVFIVLLGPPEIIKPKKATWKITAGETASIACHASGNPSPQYIWRNAAGRVVTTDKHLRLHKVNDSHAGNYTCTATNSQGSASFTILIRIASTSPRKPISSSPARRVTPENDARTTPLDDSACIIIGTLAGGTLVVVIIVAFAVWLRRDTRIGKEEKEDVQDHDGVGCQSNSRYTVDEGSQDGKKKRKPGEVLYADLENFSRQETLTVTTSQNPLPPNKKPTPYVKTNYAEITHF